MSTPRAELTAQINEEVRRQQLGYDRFQDAVAAYLGVNRTDLSCLDLLDLRGRQPAGELAEATGLTTGAVTAMLDRLERAGYVQRVRDPADRRRVLVEATGLARDRTGEVYQPFAAQLAQLYEEFTAAQLATIKDFLGAGNEFYAAQVTRVEDLARAVSRRRAR